MSFLIPPTSHPLYTLLAHSTDLISTSECPFSFHRPLTHIRMSFLIPPTSHRPQNVLSHSTDLSPTLHSPRTFHRPHIHLRMSFLIPPTSNPPQNVLSHSTDLISTSECPFSFHRPLIHLRMSFLIPLTHTHFKLSSYLLLPTAELSSHVHPHPSSPVSTQQMIIFCIGVRFLPPLHEQRVRLGDPWWMASLPDHVCKATTTRVPQRAP